MTLSEFLLRVEGVRPSGSGWLARCPAHPDRHPSLSIDAGADGRVLFNCFARCRPEAVVAALGLELRDLFPARNAGVSRRTSLTRPHSIMGEARARVLDEARRQGWAAEGVADLYFISDFIHGCFKAADHARRLAREIGPSQTVWDALNLAVRAETEAMVIEVTLDAILAAGRTT